MQTDIIGRVALATERDRHGRIINPDQDIYPQSPMMTKTLSCQMYGTDRLWCALQYLKVDRISHMISQYGPLTETGFHDRVTQRFAEFSTEETVIWKDENMSYEEQCLKIRENKDEQHLFIKKECDNAVDFFAVDHYGQNILHILCTGNTGANLCYSGNQALYEEIMSLFLRKLPDSAIKIMLEQKSCFERTPLEEALRHKRFHFALAFLKHGAAPSTEKDPEYPNFYQNLKRIKEYKSICCRDVEYNCPITQDKIIEPAVLEDGSIYEKSAIMHWFNSRPVRMNKFHHNIYDALCGDHRAFCAQWSIIYKYVSPVTNLKLIGEPLLYLPQTDEFSFL